MLYSWGGDHQSTKKEGLRMEKKKRENNDDRSVEEEERGTSRIAVGLGFSFVGFLFSFFFSASFSLIF